MRKIWILAKGELIYGLHQQIYWGFILVVMLVAIGSLYLLEEQGPTVVIVDETGEVYRELALNLQRQGIKESTATLSQEELQRRVAEDKRIDYLYIPADFYQKKRVAYYHQSGSAMDNAELEYLLDPFLKRKELKRLGLDQEQIARLEERVQIERSSEGSKLGQKDRIEIRQLTLGIVIYLSSLIAGILTVHRIWSEKKKEQSQILYSALPKYEVAIGKVLANLGLGVISLLIFAVCQLGVELYWGMSLVDLRIRISYLYIGLYILLFLIMMGALFIFMAINNRWSNRLFAGVLIFLPCLPLMLGFQILANPDHFMARILSLIPLTMVLRILAHPLSGPKLDYISLGSLALISLGLVWVIRCYWQANNNIIRLLD